MGKQMKHSTSREEKLHRREDARADALYFMNEALAVLDAGSVDLEAAARLQGAIDVLSPTDERDFPGQRVPALDAGNMLDELMSATSGQLTDFLDALSVPAYLTDAQGKVTYWNSECIAFAGREPLLGVDRWCVTWKLHTTDGKPLPHDRCPMAVAIQEQQAVRGEVAIAERPDGSRVAFRPYPTPLFDETGKLVGAVNLLIDVSKEQHRELRKQAEMCRRLIKSIEDVDTKAVLNDLAVSYEATVARIG